MNRAPTSPITTTHCRMNIGHSPDIAGSSFAKHLGRLRSNERVRTVPSIQAASGAPWARSRHDRRTRLYARARLSTFKAQTSMTSAPCAPDRRPDIRNVQTQNLEDGDYWRKPKQADLHRWNANSIVIFSLHIHFISFLLLFSFAAKAAQASVEEDRFRQGGLWPGHLRKWEESCSDI